MKCLSDKNVQYFLFLFDLNFRCSSRSTIPVFMWFMSFFLEVAAINISEHIISFIKIPIYKVEFYFNLQKNSPYPTSLKVGFFVITCFI